MPPTDSLWTAPITERYRPVLFALAALAAGYTIYRIHGQLLPATSTPGQNGDLQRSYAISRYRQRRTIPLGQEAVSGDVQDSRDSREPSDADAAVPLRREERIEVNPRLQRDTADTDSHVSTEEEEDAEAEVEGSSLLTLLFRIAEEQTRKDGYIHRGVQCNGCGENPIRGIRYRCLNCADYDLCEQCEALQIHPKTHLLYKIRIPAPFIGTHTYRQPVLYPGKPKAITQKLSKENVDKFSQETGFKNEEIEAFWEQFRCMAAVEYPQDPVDYKLALDRATIDKCFVPSTSSEQPQPSLIYDRLFSYFDTNDDGLVGFAEFIAGLASLRKKNMEDRLRRLFKGYDLDGDGFVDRKDVLRVFQSHYELTKALTADIVASARDELQMDGDVRDLVTGGQPVSSAFIGPIPRGNDSRAGQGKTRNMFGNQVINDGKGAIDAETSSIDLNGIVADNAELSSFRGQFAAMKKFGKDLDEFAFQAEWPIVAAHLEAKYSIEAPVDSSEAEQQVLRSLLRVKLAGDIWRRRLLRRGAIMRRAQKQFFSDTDEDYTNGQIRFPLEAGGILADPRLHTKMSKDLAEIRSSSLRMTELMAKLDDMIQKLGWPLDNLTSFRDILLGLISGGWSEKSLIEDLDGFHADPAVINRFVLAITRLLSSIAGDLQQDPNFKQEYKKVETNGRSRSSSKVRFEDGLRSGVDEETRSVTSTSSSRNRPANERWGGFEMPKSASDVGREAIFRIAKESINEVLDPMFRLREDFAISVISTQKNRRKYRRNILSFLYRDLDIFQVWELLDMYQRRWREEYDSPKQTFPLHIDEASTFRQFLQDADRGIENHLTGTLCRECLKRDEKTYVKIGARCFGPKHPSDVPRKPSGKKLEEDGPTEVCSTCAKRGDNSEIRPDWNFCGLCGMPSSRTARIVKKFRSAIGQEDSHTAETSGMQAQPKSEKTEFKSKPVSDPEYPDMALDLHEGVSAFNEHDVEAIEASIASKSLEELLTASGYTITGAPSPPSSASPLAASAGSAPDSDFLLSDIASDSRAESSPADPTLPQNRPNSINDDPPFPPSITNLDNTSACSIDRSIPDQMRAHLSCETYRDAEASAPGPSLCKFWAAMDFIEAEDKERGGPGRLNFEEFAEVLKGAKGGISLGLLTTWIEVCGF